MIRKSATAAFAAFALFASASFAAHHEHKKDPAIEAAVSGSWRSADAKGRDADRHAGSSASMFAGVQRSSPHRERDAR